MAFASQDHFEQLVKIVDQLENKVFNLNYVLNEVVLPTLPPTVDEPSGSQENNEI
jgi:hypothetical protein